MDQATIVILEIAAAITALGILAGYLVYVLKRPRSWFRVWTADGGELAYKMKKLGQTYTWTDPQDKKKVIFQLDLAYARRAKNGGLRFMGDPKTSALMKWNNNEGTWEYMPPKVPAAAMSDGRILQIAKATKPPAAWESYILPGLIVVGILVAIVLFMVYKMYSAAGHAGA